MEYFLAYIKVTNYHSYYRLVKVDTYEEAVEKIKEYVGTLYMEIDVSSAIE